MPALAVALVALLHPLLGWLLSGREAPAPGRGPWLLAGLCVAGAALLPPAGAAAWGGWVAALLLPAAPLARAWALAPRGPQRPDAWRAGAGEPALPRAGAVPASPLDMRGPAVPLAAGWPAVPLAAGWPTLPLAAALLTLPLAAQGAAGLGAVPVWAAELVLALCWLLAQACGAWLLARWLRGGPRGPALALAAAGLLELLALAALRWGPQTAALGLPQLPALAAAAWPALLLASAALAQGGHFGLLRAAAPPQEAAAQEHLQLEARPTEAPGRDSLLLRQTLAEREATRQRDAMAMHRQLLLQGLDHDVHLPLQRLAARLWQLADAPGRAVGAPAPSSELAELARAAEALGDALDALLNEALLEPPPLGALPPSALSLGFLVQMGVLDLSTPLRARVQVQALPPDCLLPVELNLFRLGLRHLLRHCLRSAAAEARLVLSATVTDDGAWVCLSPRLQAEGAVPAQPTPADARALDLVHRIAALHGGRLDLDAHRPPRWWLPCRRG